MGSTQFNLPDVFDTVAGVHPDRECLIWDSTRLTFSQMADRSRRLGTYLHNLGLGAHTERDRLASNETGQDQQDN